MQQSTRVPKADEVFSNVLDVRDFLATEASSSVNDEVFKQPKSGTPPVATTPEALTAATEFFKLSRKGQKNIAALSVIHDHVSPKTTAAVSSSSSSSSSSSASLIGNIFTDPWAVSYGYYIRANLMFPWQKSEIKQLWRPRFIGRVTSNQTPSSMEPNAKWKEFGLERDTNTDPENPDGGLPFPTMKKKQFIPHPRLVYVNDWGSGNSKLYGLYLATHRRTSLRSSLQYLAVRKIEPSSDPSVASGAGITGLSPLYFEALLINSTYVPMVIGSVDLAGTSIQMDDGSYGEDHGAPNMVFFLHMNETLNRYRRMKVTQKEIAAMRLASVQDLVDSPLTQNLSISKVDAQLFIKMLAAAVLQASQMSMPFYNMVVANAFLDSLRTEAVDAEPAKIVKEELNLTPQ
jgi:hypothetical protein